MHACVQFLFAVVNVVDIVVGAVREERWERESM